MKYATADATPTTLEFIADFRVQVMLPLLRYLITNPTQLLFAVHVAAQSTPYVLDVMVEMSALLPVPVGKSMFSVKIYPEIDAICSKKEKNRNNNRN